MRSPFVRAAGAASLLFLVSLGSRARADVSSWFFAGGGAGGLHPQVGSTVRGLMQLETGMGSSPTAPFVAGGMFKTLTFFSRGTDLALTLRLATGGFVRGDFGLALDAGGFERFWGEHSVGGYGALVLGAPVGLQVSAFTEIGTNDVRVYGAVAGIDFMRLTTYRTTLGSRWLNPFPVRSALDFPAF